MFILKNLTKVQLTYIKNHTENAISAQEGLLHNVPTLAIRVSNHKYVLINWDKVTHSYTAKVVDGKPQDTKVGKNGFSIMNAVSHVAHVVA